MRQSRQRLRASSSILRVHDAMHAYPAAFSLNTHLNTSHCEISWPNRLGKPFSGMGDAVLSDDQGDAVLQDQYSHIVCWAIWLGLSMIGWLAIGAALRYLF